MQSPVQEAHKQQQQTLTAQRGLSEWDRITQETRNLLNTTPHGFFGSETFQELCQYFNHGPRERMKLRDQYIQACVSKWDIQSQRIRNKFSDENLQRLEQTRIISPNFPDLSGKTANEVHGEWLELQSVLQMKAEQWLDKSFQQHKVVLLRSGHEFTQFMRMKKILQKPRDFTSHKDNLRHSMFRYKQRMQILGGHENPAAVFLSVSSREQGFQTFEREKAHALIEGYLRKKQKYDEFNGHPVLIRAKGIDKEQAERKLQDFMPRHSIQFIFGRTHLEAGETKGEHPLPIWDQVMVKLTSLNEGDTHERDASESGESESGESASGESESGESESGESQSGNHASGESESGDHSAKIDPSERMMYVTLRTKHPWKISDKRDPQHYHPFRLPFIETPSMPNPSQIKDLESMKIKMQLYAVAQMEKWVQRAAKRASKRASVHE